MGEVMPPPPPKDAAIFRGDPGRAEAAVVPNEKSYLALLYAAASTGKTECVLALLKHAPETAATPNIAGDLALHDAAWKGHTGTGAPATATASQAT